MSYEKKLKPFRVSLSSITSNNNSTSVLTDNGDIYSAGIINNELLTHFDNQNISTYVNSKIIDIAQGDERLYILTADGSVYEYNTNEYGCKQPMREIYFPNEHENDVVTHISAGRKHVIMLTKSFKAYGYGDNSSYQIVPMGEAYYKYAVPIELHNYIKVDNCPSDCSEYVFEGLGNIVTTPIIPTENDCCNVCIGIATPLIGCSNQTVPISIGNITNMCAEIEFCVQYNPSSVQMFKSCGNEIAYTYTASSTNITITNSTITYYNGSTCDIVNIGTNINVDSQCIRINGTSNVSTNCGKVDIETSIPVYLFETTDIGNNVTILSNISFEIMLNGSLCYNCPPCIVENKVKQPNVLKVAAGGDASALVDDKGKLYILGDLISVRNNEAISKNQCLDDLLSKTHGKVSFPATELECNNKPNNRNCICVKENCGGRVCNKMDLSRFKVELSLFPDQSNQSTPQLNVCDFMTKLQQCSEPKCNNTCEPCDNTVYVKFGSIEPQIPAPTAALIISTRDAVSKALGYFNQTITSFQLDDLASYLASSSSNNIANFISDFDFTDSSINFSQNGFSVNCENDYLSIDKFLVLGSPDATRYVLLYVDVETGPQTIKFITDAKFFNIHYSVPFYISPLTNTEYPQQSIATLVYGGVIPSVERNNYRTVLGNYGFKNSVNYKNPISNYLLGTYIKGGDYVNIDFDFKQNIFMATYDVPTMYCLNKRVIDLKVGNKSFYVLTNSPSCPNELYVVGNNCYGQLGLCNNISTLCIKKINRCYFDCNVVKVYASNNNSAFLTASGNAYTAGNVDNVISSNCPQKVYNCPTNKICGIALSNFNIVFLTNNNTIFGLGSNHYGQLGLGHTRKVNECHETYCDEKHIKNKSLNEYSNQSCCGNKNQTHHLEKKLSIKDTYEKQKEIHETREIVKPNNKQKSRFPKQAPEQNLCENDFKSTPLLITYRKCNKRLC